MEKRAFGQTGLSVTPICLGCASLGNMPETFAYAVSEEDAQATLDAFFDSELNFVDTAAIYGFGESEKRIGIALRRRAGLPPGFVLATKADRDPTTNRFDGDQARRSVEGSLERLGLDRLQVVYLHDPEYCSWDEITGPGGAYDVLQRYRDEGVVEQFGLAGGPIDVMLRYLDLGGFECVISHNRYTLLDRSAEPLIARCAAEGIAMLNAAPYGSGILAKGPSRYPRYMYRDAPAELVERAFKAEAVCERFGVELAAAALQFSLRDARLASTIVGMTKPERLAQTMRLAEATLPEEIWPELDRAAAPT
jgi:D-threo-aldose 1-dehydrogenase